MSLFGTNPHAVEVTPVVGTEDTAISRELVYGEPVVIRKVAVQPVASTETENAAGDVYKIIGRGVWPGGPYSRVRVIDGPHFGLYDQQGPAIVHGMTPRTSHFVVRITRRGQEVF